ncbi:uncharacterized protein LOC124812590 [Hydra vulgaris]|uniref:TP53-regulated inhibitor of apoptosis 1 n=1 Tax=Hydra vulgaris TaxID=6087 RepID=T2MJ44_HYDVU|nr:uncharacterized protein C119.18-like [Hydra vulgaris]
MDVIDKQSTFPQTERMDSIGKDCNPLKHKYDDCFNKWYSEQFLNGNWTTPNGQPCSELFTEYKACVVKTLNNKNIDIDEVLKTVLGTNSEMQPPHSPDA